MKHWLHVLLLSVLLLTGSKTAQAMVFVAPTPPTWRREASYPEVFVVFGTLDYPRKGSGGMSDTLVIECVVKSHPLIVGRKKLALHRDLPVEDPCRPPSMLVFCDVYEGKIDPFRGVCIGEAGAVYLKGLLAVDGWDRTQMLRYCFAYLDHAEKEVADDAARELAEATEKELARAARHFSTRKLRTWLRDEKTPSTRISLYGRLLGHAGSSCDAELLHQLAARLAAQGALPDEVLIALTRLDPTRGLARVRRYLRDEKQAFPVRSSALKALCYVHVHLPDFLSKKDLLACLTPLLDDMDFAEVVIDDLRRWHYWEPSPKILALYRGRADAGTRRAIVCFALQCPRDTARCFVLEVGKKNPNEIRDAKEDLAAEAELQKQGP